MSKEKFAEDETIEYGLDEDNNLVINFENLEKLFYQMSMETVKKVYPANSRELAFALLNMFSYEFLNFIFPDDMEDFCDEYSYLLDSDDEHNAEKKYS